MKVSFLPWEKTLFSLDMMIRKWNQLDDGVDDGYSDLHHHQ